MKHKHIRVHQQHEYHVWPGGALTVHRPSECTGTRNNVRSVAHDGSTPAGRFHRARSAASARWAQMGEHVCKCYAYEHEIGWHGFLCPSMLASKCAHAHMIVSGWHSDTRERAQHAPLQLTIHAHARQRSGRVDIASVSNCGCHPTPDRHSARHTPATSFQLSRSIATKRLPTQRFASGANRVTRRRGLVRCIRARARCVSVFVRS